MDSNWILERIVDLIMGGIVGYLVYLVKAKAKKQIAAEESENKKMLALEKGVKAILSDRIIQLYNHTKKKGYCRIHDKKNVEALYGAYHNLGGNGTITALVDEVYGLQTEPTSGVEDHD